MGELMTVMGLVGLLAALIVIDIGSRAAETKQAELRCELNSLRQQILTYQMHHNGQLPPPDLLAQVLTRKTDSFGQIDDAGKFGPYLTRFPPNPLNGRADVKAIPASADLVPDNSTGWLYQTDDDGRFVIAANTIARDRRGRDLVDY